MKKDAEYYRNLSLLYATGNPPEVVVSKKKKRILAKKLATRKVYSDHRNLDKQFRIAVEKDKKYKK